MVPGHEIAGVVSEIGSAVTKWKVGDKVGVGCFVDSCRNCDGCKDGFEQYCTGGIKSKSAEFNRTFEVNNWATYNCCIGDDLCEKFGYPDARLYGGYSQKITVDENYACRIPEKLPMQNAAPLLCAGVTMYSPLNFYGAKAGGKGFKTAIVGIGGLGAMGAKIAKAMGNDVYCISTSERKKEYVEKELGCTFVNSSDKEQMKALNKKLDLIVCTISADFNLAPFLGLLKAQRTFCCVGLPPNPL